MTNPAIGLRRMESQRIIGERCETPEEAVRALGALQAQDYHQAVWAVGLRTRSATIADIERAFAGRKIVLTWPMRGTLHAVPAEDVKWMLRLLTPRVLDRSKGRKAQLGLDDGVVALCARLIEDVLKDRKRISRPELMGLLENAGIDTGNQRGYYVLWLLAQSGLICLGPMEGKQQTFVLLDEWVPDSPELPKDEALARLALRYFGGHGPATVRDFAWWTGLSMKDAGLGLELAKDQLHCEKNGGREFWMSRSAAQAAEPMPHAALLPGFDEFFLGYKDREDVLDPKYVESVIPGKNGIFQPIVVKDGRVAGTWKRTVSKRGVEIHVHPFEKDGLAENDVSAEIRRYSAFAGLPVLATNMA